MCVEGIAWYVNINFNIFTREPIYCDDDAMCVYAFLGVPDKHAC